MSTASNSSSYTTDNVDQIKKQTFRHGNYQVDVVGQAKCYNNPLQISLITGSSKRLSDFTHICHWDNNCLTCTALAGYRATRSPFKVQLRQIAQKLCRRFEISQGFVSRYWGMRERKTDGVLADSTTSHVGWKYPPMPPHYKHSLHQMGVAIVLMSVESIKIIIVCVCVSQCVNCTNFGQFSMF